LDTKLKSSTKWIVFFALLKKSFGVFKGINNRYSLAKSFFINKKSRRKVLKRRRFKEYQYSIFFKKAGLDNSLPFFRKRASRQLIARNRFFEYRRTQKRLKRKPAAFRARKLKYSFFFLSFLKNKYKRRSSRSSSRKFFTNIWLVAFIFTRPIKIKKV
jgi:hypothetical protein